MSFPGLQSAPKEAPTTASGAPGASAEASAPVEDAGDGFTPEERRKNQLEEDPAFKKYLMMKRMKIPLAGIRAKIRGEGNYQPKDIDLFATREEIEEANLSLL